MTGKERIEIDRGYRDEGPAPLYLKYNGQLQEQNAFVEMDEDGSVLVYSDPNINSTPANVWHGRSLRWKISPYLTVGGIDALLKDIEDDLQAIHDGHTVGWDGSNSVGTLTDEAKAISEELDRKLSNDLVNYECVEVLDAIDWASEAIDEFMTEYRDAESVEAFIEGVEKEALSYGDVMVVLHNIDGLVEWVKERVEEDTNA